MLSATVCSNSKPGRHESRSTTHLATEHSNPNHVISTQTTPIAWIHRPGSYPTSTVKFGSAAGGPRIVELPNPQTSTLLDRYERRTLSMTDHVVPMTEIERYRSTPEGRAELAAVDLTSLVARILMRAKVISPVSQKEVSEILRVTPGRVSQVLSGDGNVTVAALAKYMSAFGYNLGLTATPISEEYPPLEIAARTRNRPVEKRSTVEEVAVSVLSRAHRAGSWTVVTSTESRGAVWTSNKVFESSGSSRSTTVWSEKTWCKR